LIFSSEAVAPFEGGVAAVDWAEAGAPVVVTDWTEPSDPVTVVVTEPFALVTLVVVVPVEAEALLLPPDWPSVAEADAPLVVDAPLVAVVDGCRSALLAASVAEMLVMEPSSLHRARTVPANI
jgi:hypothetical protein